MPTYLIPFIKNIVFVYEEILYVFSCCKTTYPSKEHKSNIYISIACESSNMFLNVPYCHQEYKKY